MKICSSFLHTGTYTGITSYGALKHMSIPPPPELAHVHQLGNFYLNISPGGSGSEHHTLPFQPQIPHLVSSNVPVYYIYIVISA